MTRGPTTRCQSVALAELFYGYSDWAKPLPLSVRYLGFNMAMSTEQLNERCAGCVYSVSSKVCRMCKKERKSVDLFVQRKM
jgi:hypothetical protein